MAANQAPPSLGFSRQEYWSGLPFPSLMHESEKWKWNRSVVSDTSWLHGLQRTRLLCPWDFPGKSTGVGCHCLLWFTYLHMLIMKDMFHIREKKDNVSKGTKRLHTIFKLEILIKTQVLKHINMKSWEVLVSFLLQQRNKLRINDLS